MTEPPLPPAADPPDGSSTPRLIIASNRLPVSLTIDGFEIRSSRSSGGLAAALQGVAEQTPLEWVGWPGCPVPESLQDEVRDLLAADGLFPVFLSQDDEDLYYHGISNQAIWPLFHYFTDKVDFQETAWQQFEAVNERFATAILERAPQGATVWLHDFHLMLVPRIIREARPDIEIGFFLHIPFPSSEIYRLLPSREDLLLGVLGSDYVGFHTHDYARHFRSSCLRVLGLESEHDGVYFEGRRIGIGVNPIGIDVQGFEATLADPKTRMFIDELRDRYAGRKLVLGVERLDYTKGIENKLRAFERMIDRRPELAAQVSLLQVIVPSRLENPEYAALKREIEEFVGRLNGRHGGPGITPMEYMHRSVPPEQLAALYRFADACLVTPVRDGMNLVAQEYVLCQSEQENVDDAWRGMLVLSEFAGAAQVLSRALLVNPWDVEKTADALEKALSMPPSEKRERITAMADQVRGLECSTWARHFLERLTTAADRGRNREAAVLHGDAETSLRQAYLDAERRLLFLDYDGTLREIVRAPEDAVPTPAILGLLRELAADPANDVHVVSGRHRQDLTTWLGELDLSLCAEHGYAWRPRGTDTWIESVNVDLSWIPTVEERLRDVCDEVPGTRVERKPCSLAWHYRMADVDYGVWRARELLNELEESLSSLPVEVVHGHRVIEVRAAGVHKGSYVSRIHQDAASAEFVLCIGDDRTDGDMYRALPGEAVTIHVGRSSEDARYSIESPARVRDLLASLVKTASEHAQR